jgi:hypothetical protein
MEPFLTAFSLQYYLILSGNHEILEIDLLSALLSVAFTFGINLLKFGKVRLNAQNKP